MPKLGICSISFQNKQLNKYLLPIQSLFNIQLCNLESSSFFYTPKARIYILVLCMCYSTFCYKVMKIKKYFAHENMKNKHLQQQSTLVELQKESFTAHQSVQPKRFKQQYSCSQMWLIEQLYIKLELWYCYGTGKKYCTVHQIFQKQSKKGFPQILLAFLDFWEFPL